MYGCEGNILTIIETTRWYCKSINRRKSKRVKILDFKDNERFITCDFSTSTR